VGHWFVLRIASARRIGGQPEAARLSTPWYCDLYGDPDNVTMGPDEACEATGTLPCGNRVPGSDGRLTPLEVRYNCLKCALD
jgi:hypothetical protein